jgi:Phosphotransferase enzyme family
MLGATLVGEIDQHHVRRWATVMRVPTDRGDLYFKANAPALRHEAALVTLVARRRPDCVPPLLAVELERGWMLMADAGARLREIVERERDLSSWLEILPLYAGVQLDLADAADELVARGAPDLRLDELPSRYERLLDGLAELPVDDRRRLDGSVARVSELCDELASYGLPETIQHDDFDDGQVFVRDGRYLLLDWGDACVSHPFFTLSVTLEGVLSWGLDDVQDSVDVTPFRDAYLAPFTRFAGSAELEAAAAIALRLGWVCRAVNARLGGTEEANTHVHLRMFLDGRP